VLSISVDDRLELHGLYNWLRQDHAVARDAEVFLTSSGRVPGEQSTLDLIQLILGNSIALGSLAVSIANWRLARRREIAVTLARGGREITTTAMDAQTIEQAISDLPPEDSSPEDPPAPNREPRS
jgi:Effector Associated Constant Component 1